MVENIFKRKLALLIDLNWDSDCGSLTFGMGVIAIDFILLGNFPVSNEQLMMSEIGSEIYSCNNLKQIGGNWSGPVPLLLILKIVLYIISASWSLIFNFGVGSVY